MPSSSRRSDGPVCYSFAVLSPVLGSLPAIHQAGRHQPDVGAPAPQAVLRARRPRVAAVGTCVRTSWSGVVGQNPRAPRVAPSVDVIPLGGLGEFGMNMLLVACGDTALLVDAGVMFPEPELFGVDLVIPDLSALDAYRGTHRGARPHARPRRPHRRACRTCSTASTGRSTASPFTLALVEPKLDEHGIDAGDRLVAVAPRQTSSTVGPFARRVPARHAQHPGLPGRWRSTRRPASSCTPATSRSTRRRSTARRSICTGLAELGSPGVLALLLGQHERRPRGLHRVGARRSSTASKRSSAARRAGSSSRRSRRASTGCSCWWTWPSSSTARWRSSAAACSRPRRSPSELGLPRRSRRASRFATATSGDYARGGRALPLHGLPGRAAGRPAADRDRRPPPRVRSTPDDVVVFSARDHPGQREGRRPGHEPPGPPGRRDRGRRREARPRVGPRQRRGAETRAFPS